MESIKKDVFEEWVRPSDELTEIDVDPDVFYDFLFSIPSVKSKRNFNEYKPEYIAKLKEEPANHIAKLWALQDEETVREIEAQKTSLKHYETLRQEDLFGELDQADRRTMRTKLKHATTELKWYMKNKVREFWV